MPWELSGNSGTDPATDFVGTSDDRPLVIRTGGVERLRIEPDGDVGVGTASPDARLSIANGGALVNALSVGVDPPGVDYPFEYETVGVGEGFNLRLQSPNSIIFHTGSPPTERALITTDGDLQLVGADCAEHFDASAPAPIEPGTVVVIGDGGRVERCTSAYDTRVAGVVSGAKGLALAGKVDCLVDASPAPVALGDLLTTSAVPGHAMKATDVALCFGAIIGKALAPLPRGRGLLPVLVALQ